MPNWGLMISARFSKRLSKAQMIKVSLMRHTTYLPTWSELKIHRSSFAASEQNHRAPLLNNLPVAV